MQPIRVLVVDDSALMRQMISRILTDAGMDVVATARDGIDALEKIAQHRPDVVTLDVEMPRLDGLSTLRRLMRESPLPVVMLSSLTQEQAPTAIEALAIGAVDVVGKPGGTISLNISEVAEEIVRKVQAAATARVGPRLGYGATGRSSVRSARTPGDRSTRPGDAGSSAASPSVTRSSGTGPGVTGPSATRSSATRPGTGSPGHTSRTTTSRNAASESREASQPGSPGRLPSQGDAPWGRAKLSDRVREEPADRLEQAGPSSGASGPVVSSSRDIPPLVVVGSSTGGPKALTQLLAPLPEDFPAPIVVVQHMPVGFTHALAARLDDGAALHVAEATPGRVPRPGEVWVARGGVHLTFDARKAMQEDMSPPHMGVRPAVDVTLESAVSRWGGRIIAVILTGMGMDGARGCRKVKQAGGIVLAQDEQSSVIYGMPRAVAEMGLADRIESIDDMAEVLIETVQAAMRRWSSG